MAHLFRLNPESLRRHYSVYVVLARLKDEITLYVGKTGDNRKGCNPMISRCGNHFSYNEIHSQIRNKIPNHETRDYTYIFEHFDPYDTNTTKQQEALDRVNEMERWLNKEVQQAISGVKRVVLVNPFVGSGYISKPERDKRKEFRTDEAGRKIQSVIDEMRKELKLMSAGNPA